MMEKNIIFNNGKEACENLKVGIIQRWLDGLTEDYVCTNMIYKEAFFHKNDTPKDWELREIHNIMNCRINGWERVSLHRFEEYGMKRGWRRIADNDLLRSPSGNVEQPF
jgi:hypothetical protein